MLLMYVMLTTIKFYFLLEHAYCSCLGQNFSRLIDQPFAVHSSKIVMCLLQFTWLLFTLATLFFCEDYADCQNRGPFIRKSACSSDMLTILPYQAN